MTWAPQEGKERGKSEKHRNDDHQNQNNGNNGNQNNGNGDGDDTGGDVDGGDEETSTVFMTICHATGSTSNPYVEITVNEHAVPAHMEHSDLVPMPAEGCPVDTTDEDTDEDSAGTDGSDGDGEGDEDGEQGTDELELGGKGWDANTPFKVEIEVHKRQGVEVVKIDIPVAVDVDIVVRRGREE